MSRQTAPVFFRNPVLAANHELAQRLADADHYIKTLRLEIEGLSKVIRQYEGHIAHLQQTIDKQSHIIQSLQEKISILQREKEEQAAHAFQQLTQAQQRYKEFFLALRETQEELKQMQRDPKKHTLALRQQVRELQLDLSRSFRLLAQQGAQQRADRDAFHKEFRTLRAANAELQVENEELLARLAAASAQAQAYQQVRGIFSPIPSRTASPHSDTSAASSDNSCSSTNSGHCNPLALAAASWNVIHTPSPLDEAPYQSRGHVFT